VAGMSIAAAGTLAIGGYSHLKTCTTGTAKKVKDLPVLRRDAYAHPVDQLIASQRTGAPLGARVNCRIGTQPTAKLYVVFNGEVLLAGDDANVEGVAYALGGATISSTGSTVSMDGEHIDKVSLTFTNEKEASIWAKELTRAAGKSPPGKRIDELIADIFSQEKHISDLQEQLHGLQGKHNKACIELNKRKNTKDETVQELEEKIQGQNHLIEKHKEKIKKYKQKAKSAVATSTDNTSTQHLPNLEERHTHVNGVQEKSFEAVMTNEAPDPVQEIEHYKSKAAEFEAMVIQKDEQLQGLDSALTQLELNKVQLMEYQHLLEQKEQELMLVSSTSIDDKQNEMTLECRKQMAQYESASQDKEQELAAALQGSHCKAQEPDIQLELAQLREQVAQHERAHKEFDATSSRVAALESELAVQQEIARQATERAGKLEAQVLYGENALQQVTQDSEVQRISLESASQELRERVAALQAELDLKRVAEEGGMNQEPIMSRALEAENQLHAMMQHHEQEKAILQDQLTLRFESDLARLREEAARAEAAVSNASRQAELVAEVQGAQQEQHMQSLSEQVKQLARRNTELESMFQQAEQQYEALRKDYDAQLQVLEGHKTQAAGYQELHQNLADLKSEVDRKKAEADASSTYAVAIQHERDAALKKLAEIESIYNQRLADVNRQMANMVDPTDFLTVQQRLASSEARVGAAEAKCIQAQQDLAHTRESMTDKVRSLEMELASAKEHAAAGDQMAQHMARLQTERDTVQQQLSQQSENFNQEVQELRMKLARAEAVGGFTRQEVNQPEEDNGIVRNQISPMWNKINEQTCKLEQERSTLWKEYGQARQRTANVVTVASCPYEPTSTSASSAQTVQSAPCMSAVAQGKVIRNHAFSSDLQVGGSLQASVQPGVSLPQRLSSGGQVHPQRMSTPLGVAVKLATPATSNISGFTPNSAMHSPVLHSGRAGTSSSMSAVPPSQSSTAQAIASATPNLRPLSDDRVSTIRSFQQPYV